MQRIRAILEVALLIALLPVLVFAFPFMVAPVAWKYWRNKQRRKPINA